MTNDLIDEIAASALTFIQQRKAARQAKKAPPSWQEWRDRNPYRERLIDTPVFDYSRCACCGQKIMRDEFVD